MTRTRALAAAMAVVVAAGCARREPPFEPDATPEAFRSSTAALMWPGATRAFQVTPAGDLDNGAWRVVVSAMAGGVAASAPRVIAARDRWRPGAYWTRRSGSVRWDFEAVALPEPAPRDSGLLVSLVARARNDGPGAVEATVRLALEPLSGRPVFVAFDAPAEPVPLRWATGGGLDTAHCWTPTPASGTALEQSWRLPPGARRELRVVLPAYPTPARRLRDAARRPHARWVAESDRHWESALSRGARFELGDPEVEAALDAARVLLLSCRERRGAAWLPIGGPFQYRDVWLRDGARLVAALAVAGHTEESRALAAGLAAYQWPNGAFLSQRGQLDGTGQALWAFEQALLRPAPDDSVGRFAAAAQRAWSWCEWQRVYGRISRWPFGTMMPYGDPRDGELVRAQLTGNDAWTLAGYRAAARLLRASGRAAEAESVETTRRLYLAEFEAALARSPRPDVPPSWQEVGLDWGNLAVCRPCGVLPATHPRVQAMMDRVWQTAGGAGLATYGHRDSLHGYVGADLGTAALLAGRRAEADRVLAALLRWRNASGLGAELFGRHSREFGRNLPPHPTTAAALVMHVRQSLVDDDDDTLRLTLGARERWWTGGALRDAPTRWGTIDLSFRRRDGGATWSWTPVPVWTSLTLPPGATWRAPLPAPLRPGPDATVVLAPPRTSTARVRLVAEPAR